MTIRTTVKQTPKVGEVPCQGSDGRTRESRRWRVLYRDFAARTPQTNAEARLRALVSVTLAIEAMTVRQCSGEPVDLERLVALTNSQGRLMAELGLSTRTEEPELTTEQLYARARGEPES